MEWTVITANVKILVQIKAITTKQDGISLGKICRKIDLKGGEIRKGLSQLKVFSIKKLNLH